jgi:dTDP-4-amino-4,6-dideoxygalactose transaminase
MHTQLSPAVIAEPLTVEAPTHTLNQERSKQNPPAIVPGAGAIPFNRPYMVGTELEYVRRAHANLQLAGDGRFTAMCSEWLERTVGCGKALLTHSCTAALEMAAILAEIGPGDEVIMPSFTFVSTANAFVLRGGVPVFVDVRPDTLNLDEEQVEAAITARTRAIVVVHYAGVACEMDMILDIAARHGLMVIEDAAQALMSSYRGRPVGSFGSLATLSFHETKNIISGEGGALLINDPSLAERAQVIREKGTNRTQFMAGNVARYTWLDIGSSYLPGEMTAAFLWGQMEAAREINERRMAIWETYHRALEGLEAKDRLRRPVTPAECTGNAHMYYVLLPPGTGRAAFIAALAQQGVGAVSHYVPLHASPGGRRFGRFVGPMTNTVTLSERLVRLPLWIGLEARQAHVIGAVSSVLA